MTSPYGGTVPTPPINTCGTCGAQRITHHTCPNAPRSTSAPTFSLPSGAVVLPGGPFTPPPVSHEVMAKLVALHVPMDEEVECWADDINGPEEHDRRFPECPAVQGGDDRACEGHAYTMQVCRECGTHEDCEGVKFYPWPCATLRIVGFDPPPAASPTAGES